MDNLQTFKLSLTVLFFSLVSGCASFEKKTSATANLQQNKITNTQLTQQIKDASVQVEQDYQQAKQQNFNYYAPNIWQSVQHDIVDMRRLVNKFDPNDQGFFGGPSESAVFASITEISNKLIQAQKIKQQISTFLAQPLADIAYLTPKINDQWQSDFNNINQDVNQIINDLENDYAASAQNNQRYKLQKKIHALEINIVMADYYAPLARQFEQLDQWVIPQSYNEVLADLEKLDDIITTSPRDMATIDQAAMLVKKAIQSAQHVTADVNWINNLDKIQREDIVLQYRTTLESLGLKFIDQDLSDLSSKAQVQAFELGLSTKLAKYETSPNEVETKQIEVEVDITEETSIESTQMPSTMVVSNQ